MAAVVVLVITASGQSDQKVKATFSYVKMYCRIRFSLFRLYFCDRIWKCFQWRNHMEPTMHPVSVAAAPSVSSRITSGGGGGRQFHTLNHGCCCCCCCFKYFYHLFFFFCIIIIIFNLHLGERKNFFLSLLCKNSISSLA